MAVCQEYRIRHSEFLDWPKPDRDKAIAYYVHSKSRCPSCGTFSWEWSEDEGGNRFAYKAQLTRCRGCQIKDSFTDNERKKGNTGGGLAVRLVRSELLWHHVI